MSIISRECDQFFFTNQGSFHIDFSRNERITEVDIIDLLFTDSNNVDILRIAKDIVIFVVWIPANVMLLIINVKLFSIVFFHFGSWEKRVKPIDPFGISLLIGRCRAA